MSFLRTFLSRLPDADMSDHEREERVTVIRQLGITSLALALAAMIFPPFLADQPGSTLGISSHALATGATWLLPALGVGCAILAQWKSRAWRARFSGLAVISLIVNLIHVADAVSRAVAS